MVLCMSYSIRHMPYAIFHMKYGIWHVAYGVWNMEYQMTILCVSSYEKGQEFIREAKRQGWRVLLLTVEKLKNHGGPAHEISEVFLRADLTQATNFIK